MITSDDKGERCTDKNVGGTKQEIGGSRSGGSEQRIDIEKETGELRSFTAPTPSSVDLSIRARHSIFPPTSPSSLFAAHRAAREK